MFVKIGQLSNKEYLLHICYIYNNLVYTDAKMIELNDDQLFWPSKNHGFVEYICNIYDQC